MTHSPPDEEAVFHAARRLRSPAERAEYLLGACGSDAALVARLLALLRVYDEEQSLGAVRLAPTADDMEGMPSLGSFVGRYKLLEPIGEGGFGTVFMAEQQQPVRRKVAVKVIKPGMDTKQVIARFEAERQALALMDHPNIARVLDAGATDAGRPYFVMELVRGVPITDYCDTNKLSTRERLELFIPVCHAVQHAHQKGVIHRDIKPTNVLVTLVDGTPVPKVIDFGIAKATGQQLTEKTLFTNFAQMVGTPLYMSPEQAELSGLDADTRSDVYSLGVLLYELLTGTTPFDKARLKKAALDEVRRIIRDEQPPRPSTRISGLGDTLAATAAHRRTEPGKLGPLMRRDLDWVVMKCLEKDRNRRYETANGLATDVRRYLSDEAVLARPTSTAYRTAKFVRKHKAGALAGAAIAAALVLGIVGTSAGLIRATNERNRAVKLSAELDRQRREALEAGARAEVARAAAERDRAAIQASEQTSRGNLTMWLTVIGFLGDMFTAADSGPAEANLTVREMLDRTVARMDQRTAPYDPRVEAAMRQQLGFAYKGLGRLTDAENQFVKMTSLREQTSSPDSPGVAYSVAILGPLLVEQNQFEKARPLLERALYTFWTAETGGTDLRPDEGRHEVLPILVSLQQISEGQGRRAEAEEYARQAAKLRASLGLDDPAPPLAKALTETYARIFRKDFATAERLTHDAIDLHRQVRNGKPDRTLVALYHNLGVILAMQGRDAEAEAAYGSSLAASETVLGKDHPDSASILAHLIYSLRAQRKDERVRAAEMRRLRIQLAMVGESIRESPTESGLHRCHGILLCRAGRFDEAVPDFNKAIELDPEDHWYWFYRGCVLACAGNSEAYRAHCAAMLRQFGGTTDRNIADRTAKACLLRPDATPDLAGQLRLVDVALAPGGNEDELPWFLLLKGLAEYRQGHAGAAVDWLERSRRSFAGADAPRATVTLLLAMAHRRLGHAEQARGLFDEARGIVDRDMPKATVDDLSGPGIENWLICHVIRREAEALFADG